MSLEELRLRRAELAEQDPTERLWWAQFQGEPRVTSGELFKTPARYATLPSVGGFRDVLGVDFAYSSKTTADWFAIVALRIYGSIAYVRNVMRFRPDYRAGIDNVRSARDMYGHGAIYSYVAGPEIGAVRYFAQNGIEIQGMPARFNKRVRAQRTIDLWNAGKILIPERAPWVASFLERTYSFRGIEGDADDEIDALVSAADGGMWSAGVPRAFGSPRVDSGRR
jgi:phage terminase large subunit-like protein